jgi:hypothetical protein
MQRRWSAVAGVCMHNSPPSISICICKFPIKILLRLESGVAFRFSETIQLKSPVRKEEAYIHYLPQQAKSSKHQPTRKKKRIKKSR